MCESGIFVGGSLEDSQDTRINLRFTRKSRDLIAKLPCLLLPLARSEQGGAAACPTKSPVLRRPRSSGEARNVKRRPRGSRRCAHHGRRSTGDAGFRRGATVVRGLHGGLGFLRSAPWSADRGWPAEACGSSLADGDDTQKQGEAEQGAQGLRWRAL
jgi:hypothetical protein